MGRRVVDVAVVFVLVAAGSAVALAQDDSPETLLEQQRARAAEVRPAPTATGELTLDGPRGVAAGDLLFVGVDDTAISTYNLDPADGTPYPQFTGNQIWGAGLIPGAAAGDAVVYFVSGSTLYRWPANGSPELCCTLTLAAATQSMVGATYNPTTGRLLMSKNIATEAIYSLAVTAGACPVSCEVTQDTVYASADNDFGGLAYDPVGGILYGTNDDSSPGPAGVYAINGDGTTTLVTAYPAGQTDIDGLAFGDGRLYLIIDEPGNIFVYDVGGASYVTPIPNPWTSSEVFSGGAFGQGLIPVELQSLSVD